MAEAMRVAEEGRRKISGRQEAVRLQKREGTHGRAQQWATWAEDDRERDIQIQGNRKHKTRSKNEAWASK